MWLIRPPWGLSSKEFTGKVGNVGLIPESGRSPGEGNGNPLQYSCLGNPMNRRAWQATVHRVKRVGHNLATKQQHVANICSSGHVSYEKHWSRPLSAVMCSMEQQHQHQLGACQKQRILSPTS